jgi:predicted AlkP superfamily phosphohydrolase/phosphomutase
VILLEFNELTPSLIDRFVEQGELPNFKRFKEQSLAFTTDAEDIGSLEPWIQWVTVHTGLSAEEHQIFRLDEGHKLKAPRVWDLLSPHGYRSWVCGSMNVRYEPDTLATVLPDPWCRQVEPRPAELRPYFRFVQTQVQEHTNVNNPLTAADYLQFAGWMMRKGLSRSSVQAILAQLTAERLSDVRWKRVTLLDRLQYDVFEHYYRKLCPAFSTLFLNSTAHYQHAYWDTLEPEKYPDRKPNPKRARYQHAILYGYQKMDALLGHLFNLAGDDATLILCTALSQEASQHDRVRYRPFDFERLLRFAGVSKDLQVTPVMADQFYVDFSSPQEMEQVGEKLSQIELEGKKLVRLRREGDRLFCTCKVKTEVPEGALVRCGESAVPFKELFYKIPTSKIADHHPDGVLWIRLPSRKREATTERVPLRSVAPTILRLMGVNPPGHMKAHALVAS